LVPYPSPKPQLVSQNLHTPPSFTLSEDLVSFILSADTVFIGTVYAASAEDAKMYPSHAGMNQRGGRQGFVRVRSDKRTVVVPDYSGNRFLQSLGNIERTPLASLTFFDFVTGNILYLTGKAKNHFRSDAQKIIPQARLVTTVEVTGYSFVSDALPVRQALGTGIERSPYSPPVRFLAEEQAGSQTALDDTYLSLKATYIHSPTVATFTFSANKPLRITPGQAVVIDMSLIIGTHGYQHMTFKGNEATLNDDGIRTWTVSSACLRPTTEFSLTLRRKEGGAATTRLFEVANSAKRNPLLLPLTTRVQLVGIAGDFILPEKGEQLLFIAGGIGVTPFLSMLRSLALSDKQADVELIVSTREPQVIQGLIESAAGNAPRLNLRLHIFCTDPKNTPHAHGNAEVHSGRITDKFWASKDLTARQIFLCGPQPFEKLVSEGLGRCGVDVNNIHREKFDY
jgi:ferredoxin-NADP reductase